MAAGVPAGVRGRGNAVLVSSHLLAEMALMADEVIVIDHGRLVRQGTVAELTAGGSHLRVASADHDALGRALIAAGLEPRADDEGGYLLESAEPERIGGSRSRRAWRCHS